MSGHRCNYRPAKYVAYTCVYLNNSQFYTSSPPRYLLTRTIMVISMTIESFNRSFFPSPSFFYSLVLEPFSKTSSSNLWSLDVVHHHVNYDDDHRRSVSISLLSFLFSSNRFPMSSLFHSVYFHLHSTRTITLLFLSIRSSSIFFQSLWSLIIKSFFPVSPFFFKSFKASIRFVSLVPHQRRNEKSL